MYRRAEPGPACTVDEGEDALTGDVPHVAEGPEPCPLAHDVPRAELTTDPLLDSEGHLDRTGAPFYRDNLPHKDKFSVAGKRLKLMDDSVV